MTASHDPNRGSVRLDRATVEAALAVAVRAPSIHNTQPWRWRLDGGALFLLADRSRQLEVADPDGHSMLLTCGAALHLTELALQAQGVQCESTLLPDADGDAVLALLRPTGQAEPDDRVGALVDPALRRRSDRRPFAHDPVHRVPLPRPRRDELGRLTADDGADRLSECTGERSTTHAAPRAVSGPRHGRVSGYSLRSSAPKTAAWVRRSMPSLLSRLET